MSAKEPAISFDEQHRFVSIFRAILFQRPRSVFSVNASNVDADEERAGRGRRGAAREMQTAAWQQGARC